MAVGLSLARLASQTSPFFRRVSAKNPRYLARRTRKLELTDERGADTGYFCSSSAHRAEVKLSISYIMLFLEKCHRLPLAVSNIRPGGTDHRRTLLGRARVSTGRSGFRTNTYRHDSRRDFSIPRRLLWSTPGVSARASPEDSLKNRKCLFVRIVLCTMSGPIAFSSEMFGKEPRICFE